MYNNRKKYFEEIYKCCLRDLIEKQFGFDPIVEIEKVVMSSLNNIKIENYEDKNCWRLELENSLVNFYLLNKGTFTKFKQ